MHGNECIRQCRRAVASMFANLLLRRVVLTYTLTHIIFVFNFLDRSAASVAWYKKSTLGAPHVNILRIYY